MREFLLVGVGGAIGSMGRYAVWRLIAPRSGGFPWATFAANVTGSFVLGLLAGLFLGSISDSVRFGVFFGVLGGYTTFSTFAVDTVELVRVGETVAAVSNVVLSIVLGLGAALAGLLAGEFIRSA